MSKYAITTETLTAQPVLSMRFTAAKEQLAAKFAEVLPAVYGHAMQGEAKPAGQPFARYHTMGEPIDVEAGLPTSQPGVATDAIAVSELPGGPAATTIHRGPYDGLGDAYEALYAWAKENDRAPAGGPWEIYLTDPGAQPDPQQWETKVILPLS
ncbi:MAG: GyrI-like domain-containing protein [Myxococcota bacterium]